MHRIRFGPPVIAAAIGALAAAALCPGLAGAASAAPHRAPRPGAWTQVTAAGMLDFADIGLARGTDGVLHVVWTTGSTGKFAIMDTPIAADGAVGHPVTVGAHEYQATFPDATATPTRIYAFWNIISNSTPQAIVGLAKASRPAGGGPWNALIPVAKDLNLVWSFSVSAATGSDGKPWVVFGIPGGFELLHFGNAERTIGIKGCCVYNPGIGVDGRSGTTWLTYYSNIAGRSGIYASQMSKTGFTLRVGSPVRLPGSDADNDPIEMNQRVTAVGRGAGRSGVYVTYLSTPGQDVDLDRIGAKSALTISTMPGVIGCTLAADTDGRIWVA
jgi:hypothetical protein